LWDLERTTTRVQQEAKLLKTYINKSFAIRVSCNILIHIIPVILGHIIVNEWRFQSHILLCTIWPKSVRIDQGVYVYDVGGMVLGKRHLKYNNIFTFCGRFYEEYSSNILSWKAVKRGSNTNLFWR
jgi:hypothetical protein